MRKGQGLGLASESHGGNQRVVDDPRKRRRPRGARRPRARGDCDSSALRQPGRPRTVRRGIHGDPVPVAGLARSEEHTSELQSLAYLVCRLLLEKKKKNTSLSVRYVREQSSYSTIT